MCGRYQRRSDKQRIAEAFAVGNIDGLALELAPDYNVAPQTMQPVIVWDENEGTRTLQSQIDEADARIAKAAREQEPCQRLMAIPGVGPLTATAVVASIGDGASEQTVHWRFAFTNHSRQR